jgi:hypothetical protein
VESRRGSGVYVVTPPVDEEEAKRHEVLERVMTWRRRGASRSRSWGTRCWRGVGSCPRRRRPSCSSSARRQSSSSSPRSSKISYPSRSKGAGRGPRGEGLG